MLGYICGILNISTMRYLLSVLILTSVSTGFILLQQNKVFALELSPNINTPQIIVQSNSDNPSLTHQVDVKFHASWPWYLARASGLTAAALLVLLILSGVGQITGLTYRILEPVNAWSVHRAIGISFGVCVLVHVTALFFDTFVRFSLVQLLIPFTSSYDPVIIGGVKLGSLYVALGIFALYIAALLLYTSLFMRETKPVLWRTIHYLSYVLVSLVFLHALFLGTDLKHGLLRAFWLFLGFIMVLGFLARLKRARTISSK